MTCCLTWMTMDAMALFEDLPCNDCVLEDVPYLRSPPPVPDGTSGPDWQRQQDVWPGDSAG